MKQLVAPDGPEMNDRNKVMASLMDAVYRQRYDSIPANVLKDPPSSDEIIKLLKVVAPGSIDDIEHAFEDDIPGLFELLQQDHFLISDVAPENRWQLIPNRRHIQELGRAGIDIKNPLLGLIYETDPGFSRSLLSGLKKTSELLEDSKNRVDLELIESISKACGTTYTKSTDLIACGTQHTRDGVVATINCLSELSERFSIDMFLATTKGQVFYFKDDKIFSTEENHLQDQRTYLEMIRETSKNEDGELSEITISDLLNQVMKTANRNGFMPYFDLNHGRFPTATAKLKNVAQIYTAEYNDDIGGSYAQPELKLLASTTLLHRLSILHSLADRNWRVYANCLFKFTLVRQNEDLNEFPDSNLTGGQSPTELVKGLAEGQSWRKSLGA